MRRGSRVLMLGPLLAAVACLQGSGGSGVSPADARVRVEVTNKYALSVEVYAVGAGIRYRLGTVHPGMASVLAVPPALVGGGPVEFHAGPTNTGGGFYRSGGLLLSAGTIVDLVIEAQLFNSTATIRQ